MHTNSNAKQSGYTLSQKDAAKLRRPVRTDVAPEVIKNAQAKMASLWPLFCD